MIKVSADQLVNTMPTNCIQTSVLEPKCTLGLGAGAFLGAVKIGARDYVTIDRIIAVKTKTLTFVGLDLVPLASTKEKGK